MNSSNPEELAADQLDDALEALWRGDTSPMNRLLSGSAALGAKNVVRELLDYRVTADAPALPAGARVGGFSIRRELGRGGMGVVYAAEQDTPARTVALKMLRRESADRGAGRRFAREIQLLARMQHPSIASIYEAGTFPSARGPQPYYTMELVDGERITAYALRKRLPIAARLELFETVCQAVHFAHQRGVIHRDIKPANILVTDDGRPKVLDFGVALATEDSDAASLQTQAGELVGTLAYMSPEQLGGAAHDVDVRTDVYSLGVVLFELLSGQLPRDIAGLSLPEAVRRLGDGEAPALSSVATTLRGDLDTILARCLEQDRARRYPSAAALADDLRRYRSGEPIEARRDSTWYVLRKLVARHRVAVATVAAFVLVLVGGLIATTIFWRESETQRAAAEGKTRELTAVNRFLHNMLASVQPERAGHDVTVRRVLDDAAAELALGAFQSDAPTEVSLRTTLGDAYRALAAYDQAQEQLGRALQLARETFAGNHLTLALCLDRLATLHHERDELPEAEALFRESLAMYRALLGDRHASVAESMNNLANVLRMGTTDEAEQLFREALSIQRAAHGEQHDSVASLSSNLGLLLTSRGDLDAAAELFEQSLAIRRNLSGGESVGIAVVENNLARVHRMRGRFELAEPLFRHALETRLRIQGADHPAVATVAHNFAAMYMDQGDAAAAEPLFRQAWSIRRAALSPGDLDVRTSLFGLARAVLQQERFADAEPLLRDCIELMRSVGADHWSYPVASGMLGAALTGQGRFEDAEAVLLDAQSAIEKMSDAPESRRAEIRAALVNCYQRWGKPDQAQVWRAANSPPTAPAATRPSER